MYHTHCVLFERNLQSGICTVVRCCYSLEKILRYLAIPGTTAWGTLGEVGGDEAMFLDALFNRTVTIAVPYPPVSNCLCCHFRQLPSRPALLS